MRKIIFSAGSDFSNGLLQFLRSYTTWESEERVKYTIISSQRSDDIDEHSYTFLILCSYRGRMRWWVRPLGQVGGLLLLLPLLLFGPAARCAFVVLLMALYW
jgi:hypothetical protein